MFKSIWMFLRPNGLPLRIGIDLTFKTTTFVAESLKWLIPVLREAVITPAAGRHIHGKSTARQSRIPSKVRTPENRWRDSLSSKHSNSMKFTRKLEGLSCLDFMSGRQILFAVSVTFGMSSLGISWITRRSLWYPKLSSESHPVTHLGRNNTHSSNGSGGETGGSTSSKSITWRIMSPVAVSYAVLPLSKSGLISASFPVSTSWKVHQLRGSVYISARAIFKSILSIKSSSN